MKNSAALQTALEGLAVPMYGSTTEVATDDEIGNLTNLLIHWVGEQDQVLLRPVTQGHED